MWGRGVEFWDSVALICDSFFVVVFPERPLESVCTPLSLSFLLVLQGWGPSAARGAVYSQGQAPVCLDFAWSSVMLCLLSWS